MKKRKKIPVSRQTDIVVENQFGIASGDQTYLEDELAEDWFQNMCARPDLYDQFLEKYDSIAILHLIEIKPEFRSRGHGKALLESWLKEVQAEVVVCWISGFKNDYVDYLPSFYQACGFNSYGSHLMVLIRKT